MGCSACLYSVSTRVEVGLSGDVDRFKSCRGSNEVRSVEFVFGVPSPSIVTVCGVEEMKR